METTTLEFDGPTGPRAEKTPTPRPAVAPRPQAGTAEWLYVEWESRVCRFMAVLVLVPIAALVAMGRGIGAGLAVPLIVLCVVISAYYALVSLTLRNAPTARADAIRWVNVTIEALFGALAVYVVVHVRGGEWAMGGSAHLVYFVAMSAISARMRPAYCLYAAAIMATSYILIYYLAIRPSVLAAHLELVPPLGAWNAWQRVFWLAMCGAFAAFVTARARQWAFFVGRTLAEKQRIEHELGRFVPRDVADRVLRGDAPATAERHHASVLFCDLRDYTAFCERESPERVVEILNAFFARAVAIVERHGGTVNKFLGDGVLALFPANPAAAVTAARELLDEVATFRGRGGVWAELDMGIGIDTGEVLLGPLGGPERVEYTAVGAVVNRAARLQGLSRRTQMRLVISAACAAALGPEFDLVHLGDVRLKGVDGSQPVYSLPDA